MPIYQYECQTCGHHFEEKQKFSDPPLTDCPICEATETVQRVIGPVGVIFKGSGFYINDSKNKKSNGSSTKDKPAEGKTGESKVGEGESKDSKSTPAETKSEKSETKAGEG
jgi:putative FmdB family regulatory protein